MRKLNKNIDNHGKCDIKYEKSTKNDRITRF